MAGPELVGPSSIALPLVGKQLGPVDLVPLDELSHHRRNDG